MTTVKEIEKAVSDLKPDEMAQFRSWFEEFDASLWDAQFEEDAKSGRLDVVAEKAITDFKKGKYRPL